MARRRSSGVLLHPTSLPGPYGIGDLGDPAYCFVDFLHAAGQTLWQVLPLGPTGFGDSPYQAFSAFAGNPLLVSLDRLRVDGLLSAQDLAGAPALPEHVVDFGATRDLHWRLLRQAHGAFERSAPASLKQQLQAFGAAQRAWLDDYATFMALKEAHQGKPWTQWPAGLARRDSAALATAQKELVAEIALHRFVQFVFFHQWRALKAYANQRSVRVFGDIPIFVAHDSADVWSHPELFFLDAAGAPTVVAGVPPDYFSATGQLWGNPLYRWDVMAKDGYAWWTARFRTALEQVDVVRLDHFRGFEAYWEIPASETTAVNGRWVKGPGAPFFTTVRRTLGDAPIVAEDLGLITPEVKALRQQLEMPGMAVLHFAFGGRPDNEYLPHNVIPDCVLYTGTHDNDTTCGWYDNLQETVRHHARCYLGCDGQDIAWDLVRAAMRSVADTVIIPAQDLLTLGSSARMNKPARQGGNWAWRLREGALDDGVTARLAELTKLFGRWPASKPTA